MVATALLWEGGLMPVEIAFFGALGLVILGMEVLFLLIRLCTRKGRIELKSWWRSEWVEIDNDGMLYRFDYRGFPIAMKRTNKSMREAIKKVTQDWNKRRS